MADTNEEKWINQINKTGDSSNCFLLHDARIAELNYNDTDPTPIKNQDNYIPTSKLFYNQGNITIAGLSIDTVGQGKYRTRNIDKKDLLSALDLSNAMHYIGISTTLIKDGDNQNPTIGGNTIIPSNGDIVLYKGTSEYQEFIWNGNGDNPKWELLGDESAYKTKQAPTSNPSASGNALAFIDTISQNENGVITATKKNVTTISSSAGITDGATGLPTGDAVYDYVTSAIKPIRNPGTGSKQRLWTTSSNGTANWVTPSNPLSVNDNGELGFKSVTKNTVFAGPANQNGIPSFRKLTTADISGYTQYTLPAATTTTLGGVIVGDNITVNSGTISITSNDVISALGYTPPEQDTNTTYTLSATAATTNSVKINLNNATASSTASTITITGSGGTTVSNNNGTITINSTTAQSATAYTGGNSIHINNNKISYKVSTTTNSNIYFIGTTSTTANNDTTAYVCNSNLAYVTPGGNIYGAKVFNAVFNDYAEYRETKSEIEPGRVVREVGNGTLEMSTERLQRGCMIVSDTFGTSMGQTEKCNTPVAVAGRALAYCLEGRDYARHHIGWPVCAAPGGMVSVMTEAEEAKYPSRIIGIISEIPDYDTWGTDNVKVNNRIWIKVV